MTYAELAEAQYRRSKQLAEAQIDVMSAYCDAERDLKKLQAENAKLRKELAKARDPQRIGGQADPSSFVYAIEQLREFRWQHATNDEDAIPYINNVAAAHERENAKLRELVRHMWGWLTAPGVSGAALHDISGQMHELGIEVDK